MMRLSRSASYAFVSTIVAMTVVPGRLFAAEANTQLGLACKPSLDLRSVCVNAVTETLWMNTRP